jgi:hypothetical protein
MLRVAVAAACIGAAAALLPPRTTRPQPSDVVFVLDGSATADYQGQLAVVSEVGGLG